MAGHLQQGGAGSPPAHLPPPAQGKQLPATRARTAALAEATVGICKCSVKNKKISQLCCFCRQILLFKFPLSCIWPCEEPFFPKHAGFDNHSPDFNISNNSATTEICANEEMCQRTVAFCMGAGGRGAVNKDTEGLGEAAIEGKTCKDERAGPGGLPGA